MRTFYAFVSVAFLLCGPITSCAGALHGAVATVQPIATDAAVRAIKEGGNAIDAAVAAALTLGVVDGHNSGIGGGCFFLIRRSDGEIIAIDGRERAPAAASRDMFVRDGKVETRLSLFGPLAAGVPGMLAACDQAVAKYGNLSLKRHLLAAAEIASQGFALDGSYAARLVDSANELKEFTASRAMLLHADGSAYRKGEILKLPDLAQTYRNIAENGIDWFYKGGFAEATDKWMTENGGLLRREDLAGYKPKQREPLRTTYRGYEIVGFPPPSSGGVHVAQILNILEQFDLAALKPDSAEFIHLVAEAMKLAFADRAYWLGDPDFAPVPRGLISKQYATELAKKIKRDRTIAVPEHGMPPEAESNIFGKHTTHFSSADSEGNWVACTSTVNTSFGCKIVIPGTGVVLNNQMDDFAIQPGVKNYFGLVGAEANAIAPGKRPLSSMSPTIVLKNGNPILSVGAAGGPTIISQTLLTIIYIIDFHMPLEKALAQTRFHHQWVPDELRIERKAGKQVIAELEKLGHKVLVMDSLGAAQAVALGEDGKFIAAHDPRLEGKAASW